MVLFIKEPRYSMKGISLPAASSASKHLNVGERNWNYHVLASEHTDVFKGGEGGGGVAGKNIG